MTALAHETQRCGRYGIPASVLVVDVERHWEGRAGPSQDIGSHGAGDAVLRRTAEVLRQVSGPVDIAAHPGRTEFLVLAIQCDARAIKALAKRIKMSLRSAGISASVGSATRRLGEDLTETWQRAAESMGVDQRRRRRLERARARRAEPDA